MQGQQRPCSRVLEPFLVPPSITMHYMCVWTCVCMPASSVTDLTQLRGKPKTIRIEDEKYMCHPTRLHFSWDGFHEPVKGRWCTTFAKLSASVTGRLLLVLHVSLLNTTLPSISSTMNKKFEIFHYWKILSVVYSVLELMKLLTLCRNNDEWIYKLCIKISFPTLSQKT